MPRRALWVSVSSPIGHLVKGVGQAVQRHRVKHLDGAVLVPGPRPGQQVRGSGHGLHAARHDDVELAGPDELRGKRDRVQPGQAYLVDRDRRDRHRNAAGDRGLPGGHLPGSGLQDLAHDHVVDLPAAEPGPLQGRLDGDAAQFRGGQALQRAEQAAERCPGTAGDHRIPHAYLRWLASAGLR